MTALALALTLAWPIPVDVCFNYGCAAHATAVLDSPVMNAAGELLAEADTPASERIALALVVGQIIGAVAAQTPIHQDRPRNALAESGVDGRMDCIDHSINTDRYLRLLQRLRWLKFHTVGARARRAPWLVNVHWTATIREHDGGPEWAVDTWFRPIGQPAAVLPLAAWREGAETE